MSALTAFGLKRSRVTLLAMMIALAIGAFSYATFPKREDPAIIVRTALVTASHLGLDLVQLEELVARPLEETARAIPGVDAISTQITGGAVVIEVDIEDSVAEADLKRVFDELRDDIADAAPLMPEGTQGPVVSTDFGDVAIATVAVTGSGFSPAELEDAADDLRDRLYALDEVAAVAFYGVQSEVITLEVDRERLATIGATLPPIVSALQGQNVRQPAGAVAAEGVRVPLRASGEVSSVGALEDVLIDMPDLGVVRLGDLVTVERGYEDPPARPVFHNGEPAVVLAIEVEDGVDVTAFGRVLKDTVEAFTQDQPIGIDAAFSTFQPDIVTASVNGALVNMLQTFVVVFLVMLAFIGWRVALVISTIVPFTVSFAFALMGPFGVELQQVSIAAIIISLGLLVDNGLVIVEDMETRIRDGQSRHDAALAAGRQFATPLLIASTTTVAAFLPLFLLDGTEGEYGYSLGAVVMLMLTGSFLSALYLLPRLAVWTLPAPKPDGRSGLIFDRFAGGYASILTLVMRWPLAVIVLGVGFVALGVTLMGRVPSQLFPLSERPQFLVYMDMPRGADITETRDTALRLSNWLTDDIDGVVSVTTFVGAGGPRFVLSLDPADVDPASAFMVVNTESFAVSGEVMRQARAEAAASFPAAEFRMKRLAVGGREPGVDVEISGPDADRLLAAAYDVQAAFATAPGVIQNRNDWGAKVFEGRIEIAQDRLREYGLTTEDVSSALDGFFDGMDVSVFRQDDELIPIVLRGAPEHRKSYEALANAVVASDDQLLALDQFAELRPRLDFSSLRRLDQRRTITISAISEAITAFDLLDHVQPTLDAIAKDLGPAYAIAISGEVENSADVRAKLGGGLPAAAAVMLMALMLQFNSFRRVAITFLCAPLVIVGVPLALLGLGQPLSFFGTLGLIALSGIIINNAIVLIDQIDVERQTRPLNEAIVAAARRRLRPILLTSMTTVLGLAPMAAAGGALWEPMATLMIGGLGVASVLTLFWAPALYRLFFRDSARAA